MSKVKKIERLLAEGKLSLREIASRTETSEGYVRNVKWNIQTGDGLSRAQQRWREKNPGYMRSHPQSLEERNRIRLTNYERGRKHNRNSGRPWTDEDSRLALSFSGTDRELARVIGRSVQAIQARRTKIRPSSITHLA